MLVYDQFEGDDTTLALRQQGVQAAAVSADGSLMLYRPAGGAVSRRIPAA